MGMLLTVAFRNLLQGGRRSMLLTVAIALVTGFLVVLLALSQGLSDQLVRAATTLGTGHVNVAGFYKVRAGDAAPMVTDYSKIKEIVQAKTPNLDFVIDRQRGFGRVVAEGGETMQAGLIGVELSEEPRLLGALELAPHSEYLEGGDEQTDGALTCLNRPGTAIMFASQAKRLGVRVGDKVTFTTTTFRGASNTTEFEACAIARDIGLMSGWNIFVPKKVVLDVYSLRPDTTGAVMVYLKDIDDADATMGVLRSALADAGYRIMDHQGAPFWMKFEGVAGEDWTGQKLDLTIWKDEVSFLNYIITGFDTLSFFLVAILLVIIGVGIMNAMWMAVRERTKEIGTLRAIGMSRWKILVMFLLESVVLGVVATTVGALLGAALAAGLDAAEIHVPIAAFRLILMGDTLNLSVTLRQLIGASVALTLVTTLAALWPAVRASRLQPVTAMQHVK